MKRILFVLGLTLSCLTACRQNPWPALQEGFMAPPDSIRVAVYWYWLDNSISKEGVVKDLEAMKSVGITRVFIGNQSTDDDSDMRVPLFSDQWWDITQTAMKTAADLDMEVGMFNCPGWSQSGGPWITPEQSMKYVEAHSQTLKGNGKEQQLSLSDVAEDRIIRIQAYPAVTGQSQTWTFRTRKGKESRQVFRLSRPFPVRSLKIQGTGTSWTQAKVLADGKEVLSFEYDRHNHNPNTGFKPLAPYLLSLPTQEAERFELVLEDPSDDVFTVTLSESPVVDRYADKSLARMFQEPLPLWDYYLWEAPAEADAPGLYVDPSAVVDLTAQLKDGKLVWTVPEGEWTVLTSYMQSTGVPNSPAVPEGTGLEVDKMSKSYLAGHYDAFVGELLRRIPPEDRRTWKVVVEDSYETGSQNWTDDMAEVFRQTYGYDPIPYLPVLQGVVVGSMDRSDRFLWDLRRLVADRVAYDYVGGLREMAHRDGMETWLECYGHWGFPSEFLLYGGQSDQVAGEYWSEGTLGDIENRAASSCGHIYGKNRIWAESCTAAGNAWSRYPRVMKQRVDRFFCEGINATLLHLYIQQADDRKPGKAAWFGNEFNRNNTWFEGMGSFITYLKRCNFLLQQGRYVADVAYFIGEDAPKMTGVCDPALPEGYSFDYINADVLKHHARVKDGHLVLDSGMEYRILVLPKQETMRPELLECIARFAREGLPVLGPLPQRSPSLQDYGQADARVQELSASLEPLVLPDGLSLETALSNLGVKPDFKYGGEGKVSFLHRTLGKDGDIYFVANQEDKSVEIEPSFRVAEGLKPRLWDPLTGKARAWDGLRLRLEPLQSLFVVFNKAAAPAAEVEGELMALAGPFTVEFAPSAGNPGFTRTFDGPLDWSRSEDPQVKYYSGKATYRMEFSLPAISSVKLNLGEVMVLAEVKVNGQPAGGVWTFPYTLDITSLVKEGNNTLEVTVYNNWRNRLIGDEQLPEAQRGTWTNIQPWEAGDELQSSGLLKPVTLHVVTPVSPEKGKYPYQNPGLSVDRRVSDLLKRMSVEDKVNQISAQLLFMDEFYENRDYSLGHVRNVGHFLPDGGLPNNPAEVARRINEDTQRSIEANSWGIPVLQHGEALHGAQWGNATCFPQSIAMAATFDDDLYYRVGQVVAKELRAVGVRQVYAPVINITRDQRWGRGQESYGEDVLMNSRMGVAYVKALQEGGVVATPKHFVDNYGEGGHDSFAPLHSWREMREVYLEPFRACVQEGGARGIMSAYNSVDGIPCSANARLLTDILKKEWGFKGIVVSDYGAVEIIHGSHYMAASEDDALAMSLNAGMDLELANTSEGLLELVKSGKVSRETLDEAVSRVLRIKFETGLFDQPLVNPEKAEELIRCPEHRELAYESAVKSMTLLKNNGILPLKGVRRIGLYGPAADVVTLGDYSGGRGGWKGDGAISPYDGLKQAFDGQVLLNPDPRSCDVLLFFPSILEEEGQDRSSFRLPSAHMNVREKTNAVIIADEQENRVNVDQEKMVRDLIATGKPVVVVLHNGAVIEITDWVDGAAAVLDAWYPGEQGGRAIADVLTGKRNPGGRLPFSWVRSIGQNPYYYSIKPSGRGYGYVENDGSPLYPFGYGLSYTTFEYSAFRLPQELPAGENLKVKVTVTNTGAVEGDEVVQLYAHDELACVARPLKELMAFKRITLAPGESREVELEVPYRQFALWDTNMVRRVEEGWFEIWLGRNADEKVTGGRVYVK